VAGLSVGVGGATVLNVSILRWLGIRCYGIYLWSWPMQLWVDLHHRDLPSVARVAIVAGLAVIAGAMSYRWIETPVRDGISWARPVWVRRSWVGTALAISILAFIVRPSS